MMATIGIGIPTVGRAAILAETLRELARQTRPADRVVVCGTCPADTAGAEAADAGVTILTGRPGLPHQRNRILQELAGMDVVVFFDDDFLPHEGYLAAVDRHMAAAPDTVVATGLVLADGIGGPGMTPVQARSILARHDTADDGTVLPVFSGYGCNMALRVASMRQHGVAFDERLPLYGWQEDVDVSVRLARHGAVVKLPGAAGVHLGAKLGRGSGVRLGYSQVANPLYLARKRLGYPLPRAVQHLACNMAMNVVRMPWPERYIDRRGRVAGNLIALMDLLRGRMTPERALDL